MSQGLLANLIDRLLTALTSSAKARDRLVHITTAMEKQHTSHSNLTTTPQVVNFKRAFTAITLLGIAYFFTIRIGYYFDWPPNVYRDPTVVNLTQQQQMWDVYYGQPTQCGALDCRLDPGASDTLFTKKMVLPAREFPLLDYKSGDLIYYRTTVIVPPSLRHDDDPLTLHSLYIWAKNFDFYVNGTLVTTGTRELFNIVIPRTLIPNDGKLVLAFRIDPKDLPYQGIAHRGDLVMGLKSKLAGTAFLAEERRTVHYLWFLLPKLAFCIVFILLYLGVSSQTDIYYFCLYGVFSCLDVFLASGYAEMMAPWLKGPEWELIARLFATLALCRFIQDYFRVTTHISRRVTNSFFLIATVTILATELLLSEREITTIISAANAIAKPLVILYGLYHALTLAVYLRSKNAAPVRARLAFVMGLAFLLCVPAQIFESVRWVIDILGLSGNTPGIYLYLAWITDLILFTVLSALIAAEFGFNVTQKKALEFELGGIRDRLSLAQSVQNMLMPRERSGTLGLAKYQVFFNPAEEMSGDWFHIYRHDDECTIFVGDVIGKGPSAALSVSVVMSVLAESKRLKRTPEQAICSVGERLFDLFSGEITTAMSAITVKSTSNEVTLFTCGAVGWITINDNIVSYIPLRAAPLGQTFNATIAQKRVAVEQGTTILTFTDGCLEGSRALKSLVKRFQDLDSHSRSDLTLLSKIILEVGTTTVKTDDQTIVGVKIG